MAEQLKIKFIGGNEIGVITQDSSGQLNVHAFAPERQKGLEELLRSFGQDELRLITGDSETIEGKIIHRTYALNVKPGDPNYLRALAGALNNPTIQFENMRLRGYVVQDQ